MRQASRLYERRDALDRSDLVTIEAGDILASSIFTDEARRARVSERGADGTPDHPRRRRRLRRRQDDHHPRAGAPPRRDQVTHVAADDYHRYDRKPARRAAITPLHPDSNHLDIMSSTSPRARRRADPQAGLSPQGRHVRPADYVEPRASRCSRACSATTRRKIRSSLTSARLPGPPEALRRKWKVAARLLAAGLHERSGPRGARPSRARLGGLHPAAAAPRRIVVPFMPGDGGDQDHLDAKAQTAARDGPAAIPDLSALDHRRRRRRYAPAGRARKMPAPIRGIPGDYRRRRAGRGGRRGDLGSHALRQPPVLSSALGQLHHRHRKLHRSESLAIVQVLVLYHLVTARARAWRWAARGSRVDREPVRS